MSNLELLLRELRHDIKKDSEESLKIVEERMTKSIIENIDKKFESIQSQIETIKKNNSEQSERLLSIEKQIRRKNLIFFGIEEGEKSYEELENKILHIVAEDMKVLCSRSEIETTSRMGKKTENKIRPIVVTFTTYGKKLSILKNKQHLKDKITYIKEDYPQQVLEKRRQLQEQLQEARNEGKIAYLREDRLIIRERNKNNDNAQSNQEYTDNNQSSRKRELQLTPPNQFSSSVVSTQPSSSSQVAKKNKHKSHPLKTDQSSLSKFLQKPRDVIKKSIPTTEESDE